MPEARPEVRDLRDPQMPASRREGRRQQTAMPAAADQTCPIGWRFSAWKTSSVRPDAQ
jgi:hypothetical protein